MAGHNHSGHNLARTQAQQLKANRAAVLLQLFTPPKPKHKPDANTEVLNDIANSFSRFAAYQQTAFDSGAARSSSSNDASAMSKQVQSAIHRVLGGGTAGGASFIAALNNAFPSTMTSDGPQVLFTPSRSIVALNQPGGAVNAGYAPGSNGSGSGAASGYAGTLSARQANLYREASVVVGDGLRLLAGLTPFAPEAELDQVEALRALIRSELNALVEEFGRVDEPRTGRVQTYFSALKQNLANFGRRSFLDGSVLPATVDDEAQIAGLALLLNYVSTLNQAWNTYYQFDSLSASSFSLSERVERANILLPVVAQANNDFEAAMDSVNFTETDRRSMAARFDTLVPIVPKKLLPDPLLDMTVYDLTDWIDSYSSEGLNILADSGQYGLTFVTTQADAIFYVVAGVVAAIQYTEKHLGTPGNSLMLEQVLSNERVLFALNNLLSQLNSLADLSVYGGSENLLV
jgi:hypothetical protein